MLDTNVIISALLFPASLPAKVLLHVAAHPMADAKDQPILNAAVSAGVDAIVSGDKHFLKMKLASPKTLSPAEFWREELK